MPVSNKTPPNPYLDDLPLRDIKVNQNLTLTKINPAYMTRQLSELANNKNGIDFHITSLNPIRPKNSPTDLEKKALKSFEKGKNEFKKFLETNSNESFFYMAPLETKKSCLKCHAEQGYEEGDIRGGISVTIPSVQKTPFFTLTIGHTGIGLIGILGILFFGYKLNNFYTTIQKQAVLDALTGIPNRRSFSERIIREFNRCKRESVPLSLIICDIDYFKAYNDTYGHQIGDECLKKVAQTIMNRLRRPADYCARYGGEEFIIILPNTNYSGALDVAENIRRDVQGLQIEHKSSTCSEFVTVSLGVATTEDFSEISYEKLVMYADNAQYSAKENGRNRVE